MRTFLQLSSLTMAAGLLLTVACGGDDDDDGQAGSPSTSSGGNGSGGDGGSGGSSGTSAGGSGGTSAGGSGGTSAGGSGGTSAGGSGGTGGEPTTSSTGGMATGGSAGKPSNNDAPYSNAECVAGDGPAAAVTNSETGAFADDSDWMDGWTNWSTDSSFDGDDVCAGDLTDFPTTGNRTLTAADSPYALDVEVYVADGETLEIEPGVVICGTTDGSLIVSRGGTIHAEGEPDNPIVFTSALDEGEKAPGNWGGVIILGKASTWQESLIEGLADAPENYYGGDDDDDDSGTFAYVRIEFGGTEIGEGNEINGLTLGAVGSGTEIHHVQVNTTLDDCFEWFGGTVDAHHLVCNNAGDDMFDVDEGYVGTISEAFGRQVNPVSSDPNGFEMDSHSGGTNTPITTVSAMNVTLCGTGDEEQALTYGMVLRENLEGEFSNIYVSGFAAGVDARDDFGTESEPNVALADSAMFEGVVHNVAYDESATDAGDEDLPTFDDDMGFDEREWFEMGSGNMEY